LNEEEMSAERGKEMMALGIATAGCESKQLLVCFFLLETQISVHK
jgi:hypothetical protein